MNETLDEIISFINKNKKKIIKLLYNKKQPTFFVMNEDGRKIRVTISDSTPYGSYVNQNNIQEVIKVD